MAETDKHLIIMGGGPAGLAAGKVITDHGVRATVLEKTPGQHRQRPIAPGGILWSHADPRA